MPDATLSPGTELVNGTTDDVYIVASVDEGAVMAYGPPGAIELPHDELLADIKHGPVTVRS